ncbi:DNA mismatch repair endonuclease MutL [Candidatus Nitrospira bockiana]
MKVDVITGKIRVLPGEVVSRIAAGEVIERPAAVVKELVDNSIDAGSTSISVEVADGGRTLIKVVDDGEGMSRADVPLAFERHATSKLQSDAELFSIRTLGFRGEALPSIAAVSQVRLLTTPRGETIGTRLEIAGGVRVVLEDAASPPGTQIEVRDLFFNTPARKKFLKTPATELSHICQVVQQAALAWPQISFRLRHNGQRVFDYPAVASGRERVLQVYGMQMVEQMVTVDAEGPGLKVEGLTIKAVHARGGRSPQELLVNRRAVRNATVTHAVYDAYGGTIAKGLHPLFVLWIEADPSRLDVNVHPAKREVRFADQDVIHRTVRRAVRAALGVGLAEAGTGAHSGGAGASDLPAERGIFPGWSAGREVGAGMAGIGAPPGVQPRLGGGSEPDAQEWSPTRSATRLDSWTETPEAREGRTAYLTEPPPADVVPYGQLHQTFLVALVGTELCVIDQHTAHERVLYERLKRGLTAERPASQALLVPETIELPPHAGALLQEYLGDLASLGLEIEPFGPSSFVVRSVPAVLGRVSASSLIAELLDDVAEARGRVSFEERVHPILASLACHSAVRAGRPMALPEMKSLIEDWLAEGRPTTCPHGRRIALRLPAEELQRVFGRL